MTWTKQSKVSTYMKSDHQLKLVFYNAAQLLGTQLCSSLTVVSAAAHSTYYMDIPALAPGIQLPSPSFSLLLPPCQLPICSVLIQPTKKSCLISFNERLNDSQGGWGARGRGRGDSHGSVIRKCNCMIFFS